MTSSPDPAEAIAAALSRLRGRGKPPWAGGAHRHGGGPVGGHGGVPGGVPGNEPGWRGGPHGPHAGHGDGEGPGGHWGRGGPHGGPPPWGQGGRFGGLARLRMLEALAAASAPLSVSEIGEAVGVDQPRASRLVQQSVELGFVRREADPDDARRTRIVLTDQGRSVVRGFRGERRDAIDSALGSFTDAERSELARLLTKLADAWPKT